MTISEKMTPGWFVRNVDPRIEARIAERLATEGGRLGVDPSTEQLVLDGRVLIFRTAGASVCRPVNLRKWKTETGVIEVEYAIAGMRRDVSAVRLLEQDVVADNLTVDEASARAYFRMNGSASLIRSALLDAAPRDPLDVDMTLRGGGGMEMTLSFQEAGHGPPSYMLSSFVLPGVASMRLMHDRYVIRPARRLSSSQNEAIGRGEGLAAVLGHELFEHFPFAVTTIDPGTGAITAIRRTGRRVARIEPRHPSLDRSGAMNPYRPGLDEIEALEAQNAERGLGRNGARREEIEQAAKRAFIAAMESGREPWSDVVTAVLDDVDGHPTMWSHGARPWEETMVEHLYLDNRARNCLLSTDARTVADVAGMTDDDLLRIPNLGRRSLDGIRTAIAALQSCS